MKKIILSDRGAMLVDQILKETDWEIKLLVLDDFGHHKEKYIENNRIERIVTLSEMMYDDSSMNINFEKIKDYLFLFNIGDYGSRRIKDDLYFSHYQFYHACVYWETFFDNTSIDFCIITNTLHGFTSDYMLQESCVKHSIPCYNVYYHFYDKYAVYRADTDCLVDNKVAINTVDLAKISSYENRLNYNNGVLDLPHGKVLNYIYKLFGSYGVRIASFIIRGDYPIHYRDMSLNSYLKVRRHIKKMERYVKKLYKPVNQNRYFIYFLHFEPEAVITGNTNIVESQLFLIRMISQALPEGVMLYVKEHPDLYKLRKWIMEYHIPVMDTFYTKYFYDTIASFRNTNLIDYHIPASELIEKSEGIATIAGTVMSEAITLNKPIIMFAGQKHLYTYNPAIFCPKSSSEMKTAVEKILDGYKPDYSTIEESTKKYLFDRSEYGQAEVIKSIEKNYFGEN